MSSRPLICFVCGAPSVAAVPVGKHHALVCSEHFDEELAGHGGRVDEGSPEIPDRDDARVRVYTERLAERKKQLRYVQQAGVLYDPALREYVEAVDYLLTRLAAMKADLGTMGVRHHEAASQHVRAEEKLNRALRDLAAERERAGLLEISNRELRTQRSGFLGIIEQYKYQVELTPAFKAERDRADELDIALQSLTPGGSEYVGDPKRCVQFVRDTRDSQQRVVVRFKIERDVERDARLNAEAEAQLLYDRIVTAYDELRYVDINDSHFQQGVAYLGADRPTLAEIRAEREARGT